MKKTKLYCYSMQDNVFYHGYFHDATVSDIWFSRFEDCKKDAEAKIEKKIAELSSRLQETKTALAKDTARIW
jgi:hypothetical protein